MNMMQERKNTCICHHYRTHQFCFAFILEPVYWGIKNFQSVGKKQNIFNHCFHSQSLRSSFPAQQTVNLLTLWAGPITFYLCSVVKAQSHPVNKSGLISDSKLSLPFTASQAFGLKNLEQEGKHSFMAALLHQQIPDALGTEKARKIGRRGIGGGQTSPYLTGVWPLSPQYWLVSKARRVGQTPKADSFVWFMSVLVGISEEPPHSIVHWCGISILPTPSILSSKGLVHPTAPCYWGALSLWAALLCEISAKELKVSHLLDGMLNSLETHSPFPVGAGAGHSPVVLLFCTLVSPSNSCPCLGVQGAD